MELQHQGTLPHNPLSPANFLDFQKSNTTLDGLEGYFTFVTPNMFNMLGRSAALALVVSVVAALPLAPLLDSQLYGVASFDPATFTAVPLALLVLASLAALVPARRAMRIDPLVALRID